MSALNDGVREIVRELLREEQQRPEYVHQRNVDGVVGLPRRDYLVAARAGVFPTTKERRLVLARTLDVLAWLELRMRTSTTAPANDANAETIALSRVGARRIAP